MGWGNALKKKTLRCSLSSFLCSVFLEDFLATGKGDQAPQLEFEQLPFSHPLFIMYSSGTTGAPKCMVHSAGVCLPYGAMLSVYNSVLCSFFSFNSILNLNILQGRIDYWQFLSNSLLNFQFIVDEFKANLD